MINPKKIEKHVANVIFEKQEGRPEPVCYGEDENGPEGDVLFINPKPVEPHIPNVDFARQADRKEIRVEQDEN